MEANFNPVNVDYSVEMFFRNAFIEEISGVKPEDCPEIKQNPLINIFLGAYDNLRHCETKFIPAIHSFIDINGESPQIANKALNFYDTYKLHFISDAPKKINFDQNFENMVQSDISSEAASKSKISLTFTEAQKKIIDQIIDASLCPIDAEHLVNAVTLSCGHSNNLLPAIQIHNDSSGNSINKPCSECQTIVTHLTQNPHLRIVSSKIEQIAKSFNDPKVTYTDQINLLNELKSLLTCPKTKRPLTKAIAFQDKVFVKECINEDAFSGESTPDFALRHIASFVQELDVDAKEDPK